MNNLTTPVPPAAWLAVIREPNGDAFVHGILRSPDDPALASTQRLVDQLNRDPDTAGVKLMVIEDDPSLKVTHGSIWIRSAACITARDNWLRRYAPILANHLYPVGGFASLANRGTMESLLHSQLAYMEDERPDLFDVKYLRDELLYYARDENQLRRRRRTLVFALYPDLHFSGRVSSLRRPCSG